MKRLQLRFMKKATESQNRLVGSMSWHVNRHSMLRRGINEEMNILVLVTKIYRYIIVLLLV